MIPVTAENELDVPDDDEGTPEGVKETPAADGDDEADFKAFIKELKAEGITAKDLRNLKESAQTQAQAQSLYTMATHWDVPVSEATQRMEMIKKHWDTLSDADKKTFDTIDGAYKIWEDIEQTKRAGTVGRGRSTGSTSKATHLYTQSEIDKMDEPTRQRNDKRITYAYANGLVQGADL